MITVARLRAARMQALGLGARSPARRDARPGCAAGADGSSDRAAEVAAVGARFLAMQGQDLASVMWALGLRVPGAVLADVVA
ncbi:MAG: hypothetical protein ACTMIR_14515, partial [Cellulomonadaceae bacterium]